MKLPVHLALFALALSAPAIEATEIVPLSSNWRMESSCKADAPAESISTIRFDASNWLKASVPSTVLAAQVAAGVFPDPYFGSNLRSLPGATYPLGHIFANLAMPPDSPYACAWWYRHTFPSPAATHGSRQWLHFAGINYSAEIWLNGHRIASPGAVAGAYRAYDFDVTGLLSANKENVLAVKVSAPTEKDLGINWVDWNPAPPDKNMGLWGAVSLEQTGPVTLRSPQVVTHLTGEAGADLTVYAELHNATAAPVEGVVSGTAAGIALEQRVHLAPHEDRTVAFSPEQYPQLHLRNPRLWWPYVMGDPHLEKLSLAFRIEGKISGEQSIDFGIREITSELTANGSRLFRINGKPILIRGGGWAPDMLLRPDSARLRQQFQMVRHMHLNTIRLEGKLENDEFFHLADEQGILVLAGWCCCDHWEHWKDWTPQDHAIAEASLHDQMLRLRSHPSLLAWLNGSDNPPTPDVERAYLAVEAATRWPNPIISSATARATTVSGESGVKMTGPYDYVAPSYWYTAARFGGGWGFNTETSPGPAIPSLTSRRKFLPDPEAWPPTANWTLHFGGGKFTTLAAFSQAMDAVYGKPASAAQFERIAQTMEYDTERAMFEAYAKNKYSSTGVIQWMLNNAWPSMFWHLYDYYLDAGAGYYATRKACEPLHIQYAYDDRSIVVVNSTYAPQHGLHATVSVHGLAWNQLLKTDVDLSTAPDSSQRIFTLPASLFSGSDRIFFVDLSLKDAAGNLLSRNFYWLPATPTTFDWEKTDYTHTPALHHEDLTALASLPQAQLTVHAQIESSPQGRILLLRVGNPAPHLAFQVHASLSDREGSLVAPVLWSDNWVQILPGEDILLTAHLPGNLPPHSMILLDSWNSAPYRVPLPEDIPAKSPTQ
ncbi:MAG: glycosyl hydrolase family 2 [Terracidiphilus sp.]|nr:glycosyl hydrolase family 2 [Terracidiphilus sp.]